MPKASARSTRMLTAFFKPSGVASAAAAARNSASSPSRLPNFVHSGGGKLGIVSVAFIGSPFSLWTKKEPAAIPTNRDGGGLLGNLFLKSGSSDTAQLTQIYRKGWPNFQRRRNKDITQSREDARTQGSRQKASQETDSSSRLWVLASLR